MEDWNERKSDVYNGAKEALEDVLGDFSVPRRERIATAVLAGFAADPRLNVSRDKVPNIIAGALHWTDLLIEALDK